MSQLQLEERRRLVESGENNAEAQLEEQYRTGTEPIRQVTEQHVAENGVEQRERWRKSGTIDQLQQYWHKRKQNVLGKIVKLLKKDIFPNPSNL